MVVVLKRLRPRAAMWELSEGEVNEVLAARKKILESVGRKVVAGPYTSLNNGDWVVVLSYPDLEAVQKVREETMSYRHLGHGKYLEMEEEILYEMETG